jgi:hypothetical protein
MIDTKFRTAKVGGNFGFWAQFSEFFTPETIKAQSDRSKFKNSKHSCFLKKPGLIIVL